MLQVYHKRLSGNSVGIVFGSYAPLHQGHLDLIMRAKKENDGGCIVIVCGYDGDKGEPLMPLDKRYRYVREFFADDDLVAVCCINDTELGIAKYPFGWEKWMDAFSYLSFSLIEKPLQTHVVWYVGDDCYYQDLKGMNETVVQIDRGINPICATMIRSNPILHWDRIATPFKRIFSTNILITGTASEGKTTLTRDLGRYFGAPYSYEWARGYMRDSCVADWELDSTDFMAFLQGQYDLNKKLINSPANHGIFFADTDALVTKMYAKYYAQDDSCILTPTEYEKVAVVADELARKSRWDKIFIIGPHNKFVDDHERYMAHSGEKERNELYDILCEELKQAGYWDNVVELHGTYYENFMAVKEYVKGIIENGKGLKLV